MTYDELVTAVQDYCENNFPTVDMNRFIQQAEQKIYNSVQLPSLRKNVVGVTSPSNKYLSCPDDYLASFSLAVIENYGTATEAYYYLLNKDVNFIREAYSMPSDTGLPLYYSLFGPRVTSGVTSNELTFLLGPTPNAIYRMELHYYYYPESIVTAINTWLGDNFDTALLCGTLMEAITYMKGEADIIALYKLRYDESMALLKQLGDAKEKGDSYRDGVPKYKVV
jgi:hypothetical protein